MWKLNDISNADLAIYRDKMFGLVKDRFDNFNKIKYPFTNKGETARKRESRLRSYINMLPDNELIALFISKPNELEVVNERIMSSFFVNYHMEFPTYLQLKEKGVKRTSPENVSYSNLNQKYKLFLRDVCWLLGYDDLIAKNKEFSYWLCKIKGSDTCTYCNRQYTFTVLSKLKETIVRPQLDHWRPKSLFPLMSLSFYNLIPSCPNCNSSSKGSAIFSLTTHIHPYIQKSHNPEFDFHAMPNGSNGWNLEIRSHGGTPVDNMIKAFKLEELYATHNSLEVQDMMDLITHNSETYLKTMLNQVQADFPKLTQEDAIRMLLGFESNAEKLDRRPLSKLKRDLLSNAGVI